MYNVLDFKVSSPGNAFGWVHTHVTRVGPGNYLEFPYETLRCIGNCEFQNVGDTLNRGVYGYLSFGYGSQLSDKVPGQYLFAPPDYINYDHQTFRVPTNAIMDACRVWVRKGCTIQMKWLEYPPATVSSVLILPGKPPQAFPAQPPPPKAEIWPIPIPVIF